MQSLHRLVLDPRFAEHGLRTGEVGPREEGVLTFVAAVLPCILGALGIQFATYPPVVLLWLIQSIIVTGGMVLAYRANAAGDGRDFARRCVCVAPGHFIRAFVLLHIAYAAAAWLSRLVGARILLNTITSSYAWLSNVVLLVALLGLIASVKRLSLVGRSSAG